VAVANGWPRAGGTGFRVLLVGPHALEFVDEVAARAPAAAVLVRSYPDACALGERHPGMAVHCGRLETFAGDGPYDLILALDGLWRTHSAEAPAAPWRESLAALAALVAPGGRLVLGVRNDLGIDRILEARPAGREGGDGEWEPHGFDPTYPNGPAALDCDLESAGLAVSRRYAAYPDGRAPRALISRESLAHDLPDALTFPLSARGADRMLVADPLRLTRLAFRHGLGADLAPLWLVVATREPAAAGPVELPLGLIEEARAVHEIIPVAPARTRRLPDGAERPIPAGRVVEEILVEACAREDVRAVRELLGALARWVEDGGDATAATDTLVWDGERFAALTTGPLAALTTGPLAPLTTGPLAPVSPGSSAQASGESAPAAGESVPAGRVPDPGIVLCRILWRFAVRLLAAGHHHPWPWPLEADQLTLTLCGMAGRECDRDDLDLARKFDAELGRPAELADSAPTYRDLAGARDRLTEQLTAAMARIARLETKLTYRERELVRARSKLRRTQRKASAYRRSVGYRLSRRLSGPRQVARRVMRLLSG